MLSNQPNTQTFKSPHSPPHLWRRCVKSHWRRREERKRTLAYLVVNAAQFAARVLVVVFGRAGLHCGWPLASALTCSGLRPALALVLMVASGGKYLLWGKNLRWNSWFCCSKLLKERWRVMAHRRLSFISLLVSLLDCIDSPPSFISIHLFIGPLHPLTSLCSFAIKTSLFFSSLSMICFL